MDISTGMHDAIRMICMILTIISLVGCMLSYRVLKLPIIKNSLINQFISFLMFAEIINNLNQLSGFIQHYAKSSKADNFYEYMRICYVQICLNNLSNYLNLNSSVVIAIYSFNALTNEIPHAKWVKYLSLIKSIIITLSSLFSYTLWMIHMQHYQNRLTSSRFFKRANTCSVYLVADIIGLFFYWIMIIFLIIFCLKSWLKLNYFKKSLQKEMSQKEGITKSNQKTIDKMKYIQKKMLLLPIISFIIFAMLTAHRLYYMVKQYKEEKLESKDNTWFDYICFVIPSSLRGIIFTLTYFILQPDCWRALIRLITCNNKKNYSEADIIKEIESAEELDSEKLEVNVLSEEISEFEDDPNEEDD